MKRRSVVRLLIFWFLFIILICLNSCFYNKEKEFGKFYSLEEAVGNRLINEDDLLNIAYYFNDNKNINGENFELKIKNPSCLSDEIEKKIKQTHLERIIKENTKAKLDGIKIKEYYGTYNKCVAVFVQDNYRVIDVLIEEEYILNGVKFLNFTFPGLEIWCEK